MKFIKIFFLSILSTSLAVINTPFFCKTQFLFGIDFSKSLLYSQNRENDYFLINNNENKSVYYSINKINKVLI